MNYDHGIYKDYSVDQKGGYSIGGNVSVSGMSCNDACQPPVEE